MASKSTSSAPTVKLTKIEAGVYETTDGAYQIQRNTSMGEWDETSTFWTVEQMSPTGRSSKELHEAPTKRECVEWLAGHLSES